MVKPRGVEFRCFFARARRRPDFRGAKTPPRRPNLLRGRELRGKLVRGVALERFGLGDGIRPDLEPALESGPQLDGEALADDIALNAALFPDLDAGPGRDVPLDRPVDEQLVDADLGASGST